MILKQAVFAEQYLAGQLLSTNWCRHLCLHMETNTQTFIYLHIETHAQAYMFTHKNTYIDICLHMKTYTNIYVYTWKHIHRHKQNWALTQTHHMPHKKMCACWLDDSHLFYPYLWDFFCFINSLIRLNKYGFVLVFINNKNRQIIWTIQRWCPFVCGHHLDKAEPSVVNQFLLHSDHSYVLIGYDFK